MQRGQTMQALDRNISAVHRVRQQSDDGRRFDERGIDRVASFLGSPGCLYFHILLYGTLITLMQEKIYLSLSSVSLIVSLEAIFLAIFVPELCRYHQHENQQERWLLTKLSN